MRVFWSDWGGGSDRLDGNMGHVHAAANNSSTSLYCQIKVQWKAQFKFPSTPRTHIGGSRGITPLILNVGSTWRWVVNFKPLPLYPWKGIPVPGWAPEQVWAVLEKEKSFTPTGIRSPDHPVRRQFKAQWLLFMRLAGHVARMGEGNVF